ncbi:asparagine synthase C-terminal domain-containing protein [Halobaculum magnesiiphilum]|uniref:Asparagine synthase C-terminal domain-containing protein n=1 Tax=Halobaculum magnesiiphilum TaxID=1017351 RepID=A0A8T8WET5_9EURY|nr:asparagine synthase C-terminal domain-containing protein [Halobaculum magnesiiphilum]QZP38243.1 asparagine synthase C-terminal domain-containing protein [Halobaculum magnesiiphilum]
MDITCKFTSSVEEYEGTKLIGFCQWRQCVDESNLPIEAFSKATTRPEVKDVARSVTGFFSVLTPIDDGWCIAADYINSYPIYYVSTTGPIHLTDSQEHAIQELSNTEFDTVSTAEYRTASYVTGPQTLLKGVSQSQAGEIIHLSPSGIDKERYFNFEYGNQHDRTFEHVHRNWEICISRLIEYANGRPIWVPLSAGFDSRYIVTALAEMGYPNLNSFSWSSRPQQDEHLTAERVARSLGVEHHHWEPSHEDWRRIYRSSGREELDNQLWLSSVPVLREWGAVRELANQGTVPENSVIVPGHSGDMIAGSHLSDVALSPPVSEREVIDEILRIHYRYNAIDQTQEEHIRERIRDVIQFGGGPLTQALEAVERFDWRERQAKWITAATKTHGQTGLDWWLPFWDAECVDFWLDTSFKQRSGRRFQRKAVQDKYRSVADNPVGHFAATSLTGRIKNIGRESRIEPLLRKMYNYATSILESPKQSVQTPEEIYENLEYRFGMIPRDTFLQAYNGDADHRAYRARLLLGDIDVGDITHPIDRVDQ